MGTCAGVRDATPSAGKANVGAGFGGDSRSSFCAANGLQPSSPNPLPLPLYALLLPLPLPMPLAEGRADAESELSVELGDAAGQSGRRVGLGLCRALSRGVFASDFLRTCIGLRFEAPNERFSCSDSHACAARIRIRIRMLISSFRF